MNLKKEYSKELIRVLDYAETILATEYPTNKITIEYLLLAILEEKNSIAYEIIKENVLSNNIETTQVFLARYLSSQLPKTEIKENVELKFDENLENIIKDLNEIDDITTISTTNIISQILKTNTKMKRTLHRLGVTASHFEKKPMNESVNKSILAFKNIVKKNMEQSKLKSNKSLHIEKNTINLNKEYGKGQLTELIGREKELKKIFQILNRQSNNKVLIIGESGTGKSTMINGFVDAIETYSAPTKFIGKTVVKLDVNDFINGLTFKDLLDEKVKVLNEEITKHDKHVLFIDDIHLHVSSKTNNPTLTSLEPLLLNNKLPIIMVCNIKYYKQLIEAQPLIEKEFERVLIKPTSIEETNKIINSVKHTYEKFHNVKYNENIVGLASKLSDKYLSDKQLPFAAISLIDMVGSDINSEYINNKELISLYTKLNSTIIHTDKANSEENYELVDELLAQELELRKKINEINDTNKKDYEVTEDDLYRVITTLTDVPINRLDSSLKTLKTIDKVLKTHVIGQDDAIDKVTAGIKRKQVGLGGKNKPLSFMCIGESGTGKTLLAKTIAKELLGSEQNLIRYDMSEFSEKYSISKLIGSPPGYVSHESGGSLTEAVKHKKYSVLLLDEIEKACPEVFNLFLQLLDDGFLTDSSGTRFDFSNVIVMMTSNVGAKKASEFSHNIGFNSTETNSNDIINKEFKKKFPPEFINRLTDTLIFNKLGEKELKNIIKLNLNNLNNELIENGYKLSWTNNVITHIYDKIDKENGYGARPINRFVENEIETKIIDKIVDEELKNYEFKLNIEKDELLIN